MSIFEELLSKSDLSRESLEEKVNEFKIKNPDLNNEIASFFVAKELGIDIDDSKLIITPLNLIDENTKNANILVNVERAYPKKEFDSNNRKGELQNLIVTDNTASIQLTIWNPSEMISQGDVILVTNVFVNVFKNEKKLNTSKFSSVKIKDKKQFERKYTEKKLYELQDKDTNLKIIGTIREKQELKEFESQGQLRSVLRFTLEENGFKNNCVAWGNSTQEINTINLNTKIEITGAYAKLNKGQLELHLNDYTKIKILEKDVLEFVASMKTISELAYNEYCKINSLIKGVNSIRYVRVCKVCGNQMMKIEDKYFCSTCNAEQENYAKANAYFLIEDSTGNTFAILTKKVLMKLLNCDEFGLEEKLNNTNFEGLQLNAIGYLRKNKNNESEFFVDALI